MRKIGYIGSKELKMDNVAGTGLSWRQGEVHEIADNAAADKLLEHSSIWVDATKDGWKDSLNKDEQPQATDDMTDGKILIMPDKPSNAKPFELVVPRDIWNGLRNKSLETVFMTPEDANAYAKYKEAQAKVGGEGLEDKDRKTGTQE